MTLAPGSVLLAAVAAIVIGTALCFVGIVVPGVFVAGTRIVLLGLVGCGAAGVLALVRPARTAAP